MKTQARIAAAIAFAMLAGASATVAQAPGIKRTLLQRGDIGNNTELIMGMAEIAPGGSTGPHTHFGTETGYAMEGNSVLEIEGEAPRPLKAGDTYIIPAGKVHDAKNTGAAPARVLAVYAVEKGKPLATPAQK